MTLPHDDTSADGPIGLRPPAESGSERPIGLKLISDGSAWHRLHPLTIAHDASGALLPLLIVGLPVWMGRGGTGQFVSTLALGLVSLVVFGPLVVARFLRFRYRLTASGVEVESGIFARQHRALPYDRVQAVEVERPLLARLLGTARVHLMTGSGTGAEATLAYVSADEAERLSRVLRDAKTGSVGMERPVGRLLDAPETARMAHSDGSVGEEPTRRGTPEAVGDVALFRLTGARLLRAGLYRVSLGYLAVAYSALQLAGFQPEDLRELAYDSRLSAVRSLVGAHPAVAAALFVALGIGIAWAAGIVTTVLHYAGFVLTDDGPRLHTRGGLVSRWTRTLPRGRVQAFVRRSHAVMRRAGFVRLDVQMLGASSSKGGAGGSLDALAPLARLAEADALVASVRLLAPVDAWHPPSPLHARRLGVRYAAAAALVPAIGAWLSLWALWGVALVPLAVGLAWAQARAHRYALTDDALHVESGAFWRTRRSVPRDRTQAVTQRATWMQRRRSLASVVVDTAAGPALGLRIHDLDTETAAALVADLRA